MNAEIQAQFDRVETALNLLIDSITSYNPSQSVAAALVEADVELTKGLERLAQHQSNHNTLLSLRATSADYDNQIKSTLSLLVDVRKELLTSTPITAIPAKDDIKPIRALEYAELLDYAQRIARFTVPPNSQRLLAAATTNAVTNDQTATAATSGIKLEISSPDAQQQMTTPVQTPAPALATPAPQAVVPTHLMPPGDSRAVDSLPEEVRRWLDPSTSNVRYTPWPGEDVIRRGALARVQGIIESGQDPNVVDVNGADEPLAPDGTGERGGNDIEVKQTSLSQDDSKPRRVATAGRTTARVRQESRDEGLMGFDLYNPDED